MCPRVGLCHLVADLIQDAGHLVVLGAQVTLRLADQGHVADPQILQRPIGDRVEVAAALKIPEFRQTLVAAPAEGAGAVAKQDIRRERQGLGAAEGEKGLANDRLLGLELGTPHQGRGDQFPQGNLLGHDRRRNRRTVDGLQAAGRIEIQQAAERRRRRQQLAFRLHDVELAPRQLRRRPIGIRLPALAGLGVGGRKTSDFLRVVAILDRHRSHALGAEQLFVGRRDLEQDVVAVRLQSELALDDNLLTDEVIVEQFRKLLVPDDAGDCDRSRGDCAGPRADVQRLTMDIQHRAGRLLEIAAVVVIVHAGIDARKELRGGILPLGGRFRNPLAGDHQFRIADAGQPQRAVKIDRSRIGTEDRRGGGAGIGLVAGHPWRRQPA